MVRGAWQSTAHAITKSETLLKQLTMHAYTYITCMLYIHMCVLITQLCPILCGPWTVAL